MPAPPERCLARPATASRLAVSRSRLCVAGVPIARDAFCYRQASTLRSARNATIDVSYVGQLARHAQHHVAKDKVQADVPIKAADVLHSTARSSPFVTRKRTIGRG